MLHLSQTPRVNPQDNLALKEKMWWAYLKIWIPEVSSLSCLSQTRGKETDVYRERSSKFLLLLVFNVWLLSRFRVPESNGLFFSSFSLLSLFFSFFLAEINNIPFPSCGWFIKAIALESASPLLLVAWVKDIWSWSVCACSQYCNIWKCICICENDLYWWFFPRRNTT